LVGKPKEKRPYADPGRDRRILLKQILRKYRGRSCGPDYITMMGLVNTIMNLFIP
jgi:hypothetical protein